MLCWWVASAWGTFWTLYVAREWTNEVLVHLSWVPRDGEY